MQHTIALIASLAAHSVCDLAPGERCDPGGAIRSYMDRAYYMDIAQQPSRIGGICASACTIYLGVRGVCAEPDAWFAFHAARYGGAISKPWTDIMFAYYPAALRSELHRRGAHLTREWTIVSGRELAKYGIRQCR